MDLQSIEQRINAEYIKHKDSGLDWVKLAASKIFACLPKPIVIVLPDDVALKTMVEEKYKTYSYSPKHYYQAGLEDMRAVVSKQLAPVKLVYEDGLPEDMSPDEYAEWYKTSEIVDGVRMGKPFVRDTKDINIKRLTNLCTVHVEYEKLLTEELDSMVGLARLHGWESRNDKLGKICREKIEKLSKK